MILTNRDMIYRPRKGVRFDRIMLCITTTHPRSYLIIFADSTTHDRSEPTKEHARCRISVSVTFVSFGWVKGAARSSFRPTSVAHACDLSLFPMPFRFVDVVATQDDREDQAQLPIRRLHHELPCADDFDDQLRHNPGEH